jgi:flagellar protein FlaH
MAGAVRLRIVYLAGDAIYAIFTPSGLYLEELTYAAGGDTMLGMTTSMDASTTGVREIALALGGGIREGSLVLIEGEAKAGKSVLSQYIAYGVLSSKDSAVAYYTADSSVEQLIAQMDSLSLYINKDFVTDRLRIYSLESEDVYHAEKSLQLIVGHISRLPTRFRLVMVDSTTPLMERVETVVKMDFLQACRELCEQQHRSIVLVVDSHVFERKTLLRAYAMSDYYLKLRSDDMMLDTGQMDTRVIKILEVTKLRGAERLGQEAIKFEIKPRVGIQILPFVKVRV